jgi:uncharacterized protein (DUF488 family)
MTEKHPVYSFGYQGQSIDEFIQHVHHAGALVIDTRLKPYSRDPTWNKSRLEKALGQRYRWIEQLGNLNYKGGPIVIKDLDTGLRHVEAALTNQPVVLICVCKDVRVCHRNVILGRLREAGFMTIEWGSVTKPAAKSAKLF